ncbi:MAG: hypothetical protein AAFX53_11715, partial [Bacteroidota bacterium]
MGAYKDILQKLNRFTKRFYTKMLIQGILLFLALGLVFFLVIMALEYFLWLGSTGRLILFWTFIAIEAFLLYRFIMVPLLYLFRLRNGISNKEASRLIGRHFGEVNDKLYNLLDLAEDKGRTELLMASLEQRSQQLHPIPFLKALDLRESLSYSRYLLIPALIFLLIWATGGLGDFFGSYNRVVNYKMAYEPPAPFSFKLLSPSLEVLENQRFTVRMGTEGKVRPENAYIVMEGKEFLLRKREDIFEYTFEVPLMDTDFYFTANDIDSRGYRLVALEVPSLKDFKMLLDFPSYTGKGSEVIQSTGNAVVPEGTRVTWRITAKGADEIRIGLRDSLVPMERIAEDFEHVDRVYRDLPYTVSTSNAHVADFETLQYRLDVVRDAYPSLRVKHIRDSIRPNISYFSGEAADDYGIQDIMLVYYLEQSPDNVQTLSLLQPKGNFQQFYYTFPSGLELEPGQTYNFYFQVTDNDGIRNGKTTKSAVFSTRVLAGNELRNKELENAQKVIRDMGGSLRELREQKEELREISKEQKESKGTSFSNQSKVRDFLRKQKEQERLMEKFSKQLKGDLKRDNNRQNELLRERMERQEMEARKNKRLLEELEKVADRINKEELTKRLEELGKRQQTGERNLEQLLELTKRYYVTEKAAQLGKDLEKLAKRQEILSELKLGEDFSAPEQQELNKRFDELAKEMEELRRDNKDLKKPLDLQMNKSKEESIRQDQQDALEEIKKHHEEEQPSESGKMRKMEKTTKDKQKSAAQKMMQMSGGMMMSGMSAGGSSIVEDAEMLRQVLDNLVIFSFKQEALHDILEASNTETDGISNTVRKQKELRNLFEHVDDSIFALSLRRVELSEFVNEQISEAYYNMDKALERIAENQTFQAVSYQKYVLNASNELADFLANVLDGMQQSMMGGMGQGTQGNFQLPDIIQGQQGVQQRMQGMGKQNQGSPQQGQGERGKVGKGTQEGELGKDGISGKEGQGGKGNRSSANENGGSGGQSGDEGGDKGTDALVIVVVHVVG